MYIPFRLCLKGRIMKSSDLGKKGQVTNVFLKEGTMVVKFDDGTMLAAFSHDGKLTMKPYVVGYVKFKSYPIEQVLPFISKHTKKPERLYDGISVKMGSVRYQCFDQSGTTCVACGLEGLYFTLERDLTANSYHFNLYGKNDDGNEVMLTKDHIIPASKSGSNGVSNMQTMCSHCNTKKGTKVSAKDLKNGKSKKKRK